LRVWQVLTGIILNLDGVHMSDNGHPRPDHSEASAVREKPGIRLDSWKEIASYLLRSERTVRRWEDTEELPVHRQLHEKRGSVYAYTDELDAWRLSRRQLVADCPDTQGRRSSRLSSGTEYQDGLADTASDRRGTKPPSVPARIGMVGKRWGIWILIAGVVTLFAFYRLTRPPGHAVPALVEAPLTAIPVTKCSRAFHPTGIKWHCIQ
jgi:hypothetical protein